MCTLLVVDDAAPRSPGRVGGGAAPCSGDMRMRPANPSDPRIPIRQCLNANALNDCYSRPPPAAALTHVTSYDDSTRLGEANRLYSEIEELEDLKIPSMIIKAWYYVFQNRGQHSMPCELTLSMCHLSGPSEPHLHRQHWTLTHRHKILVI